MQPNPEIASAIAERYSAAEQALAMRTLMRRHGLAALSPEALYEYLLLLGSDRRFDNRIKAMNRVRRVAQASADRAAGLTEAGR